MKKATQNKAQPPTCKVSRSGTSSRMGVKYPTKVTPVAKDTNSQMLCLPSLRTNLLPLMGALSSFMRWLRSPSVTFSAHMKTQVNTLCGQV